jgi:PGF-pre-PGF domain-containing protein
MMLNGTNVTANATITSSSITYRPRFNLSYTTHHVTVSVSDTLGNQSTARWSFTINNSEFQVEEDLGNLTGGNVTEVILDPNDTCIVNINITAATNLPNVKIAVARLADKPTNIADNPKYDSVYEYLNIELTQNGTQVSEDNLDLVTIKFRIRQSWLDEQKINKSSVVFERYHDGKWQDLTTG